MDETGLDDVFFTLAEEIDADAGGALLGIELLQSKVTSGTGDNQDCCACFTLDFICKPRLA
jgi:hypothetical protein